MTPEAEPGRQKRTRRKWVGAAAVLLIGGATVALWNSEIVLFPQKQTCGVFVMDDCDDDFRTPPFEDALIGFGPRASRITAKLNLCETVGGARALTVSP